MRRKIFVAVSVLLVIIATKLWVGVYQHDEFNTKHVFMKHRPIWKSYFYSPRGMSDLKLTNFPAEEQKEQILFEEFVLDKLEIP